MQSAESHHLALSEISTRIWTAYGVAGLIAIGLCATPAALLHQWLIHRMTFPLFRVYAALVSTGIGGVWGWCLWIGLRAFELRLLIAIPLGLAAMLILCLGFGYAGWRWTAKLRGNAPVTFTFITREEFEGST